MRKIRVFEHISLDGMIEPGARDEDSSFANGRWTAPYRSPAGAEALAEIQGSDTADPRELALVSSKATSTGMLVNTYRYVGSLRNRIKPPG